MRKLLIFFIFCASTAIIAEEIVTTEDNDLCSSDEQVILLCKAEYKTAGICASKNLSNLTGFAQYRVFDIDKKMIEFVFPEKLLPPDRNFIMETEPLPGGIDVKIKFSNNGLLYIIHERDAPVMGEGFEGFSKIIVRNNEKILESIKCLNEDSEIRRAGYDSFFTQD
ncbi:hypothetical protein PMA3_20165 [Pseudomonas silesiensis]|uniref:Uncharacterized protein n=1 Tax=Pseudomonas silesiensis TaxID=1853130 RepID=A0A191YWR5_9PSED|nr:hypothetical protein [Pseudomonas silesiensis]ANJ57342.1 hypothetical protein PMA3_20165 [Pseudomonas silesiensis]